MLNFVSRNKTMHLGKITCFTFKQERELILALLATIPLARGIYLEVEDVRGEKETMKIPFP